MKLFNTLGRQLQAFKPINPNEIKLYTCGPTVYNYAHIGNLRAYVFDDTLRRALQVTGYQVKHIMNITDVGHLSSDEDEGEDKLERGAARENKTVWEVAEFYVKAFEGDVKALNILPPNGYDGSDGPYARATNFIDEQIKIVQKLIDKGFAYRTEQAIYFDVTKLDNYGRLTGQKLSEKETAARADVVTDKAKNHPQDFAVWFFKTGRFAGHSMAWPSQWGEGFPGWHLECSAIIHATLGEPIDIHTGGVDHIGTHHTNEIAQTEAAFGVELAHYWLHNEHLLVNGAKMAKSAGNFYTLKDIIAKGYDPLALRLLFLQSHYRSQMNFTWDALNAAQTYLKSLQAWADSAKQTTRRVMSKQMENQLIAEIKAAMADDLNSARALAAINQFIDGAAPAAGLLEQIDATLGLRLSARPDITAQQKQIIKEREAARRQSNWQTADGLRHQLLEQGIELDDTASGSVWRRA